MISSTCSLIQKDLFGYDIVAAFPTILSKQNFDFQDVDLTNKEERNIFIGKSQIGNENLSSFLQSSVDNLLQMYLVENNIQPEEVIYTQRDGFILKKLLENNNLFDIQMTLREYIDFMIISIDRKKFIYSCDGIMKVKGVPHYYDKLNEIYQQFVNFNFYNKRTLFQQMEHIKRSILDSTDKKLFAVPGDDGLFTFVTYKGNVRVKDVGYISLNSIDKMRYFVHYFKDFLSSIYLETY